MLEVLAASRPLDLLMLSKRLCANREGDLICHYPPIEMVDLMKKSACAECPTWSVALSYLYVPSLMLPKATPKTRTALTRTALN